MMTANKAYSPASYLEATKEAIRLCEQFGLTNILADIRSVNQRIPVIDRFQLGIELAKMLGPKIRLAILARPELIDKTGENTAVNRGGRVLVTLSLEEALVWFGVKT